MLAGSEILGSSERVILRGLEWRDDCELKGGESLKVGVSVWGGGREERRMRALGGDLGVMLDVMLY